ncbi:MAG: ribosome biogenesis GTPase Der [Bdellovibrionota bacterium]
MIKGLVAIVGRPNVGKSTLFNKLTGDAAIVDDRPGVTRDRLYGTAYYDKHKKTDGFMVIDTGGFETDDFNFQPFDENVVWRQTEAAIAECDLVLFLLDAKNGLHFHDEKLSRSLQLQNKPMIYAVNKVDGLEKIEQDLWDFYSLGTDELYPISAAHSHGIKDLVEVIKSRLNAISTASQRNSREDAVKVALIGKPNAGKSSILNRLVGEERAVVSEIAGTTRDCLDIEVVYHNKTYVFIDTAGIRRKTRIKEKLEVQSVVRSLRCIEEADVVLLVIDALEGITDQDARLVNLAMDRRKPLLIVVNKWDLVPNKNANTAKQYEKNIKNVFQDHSFLPVAFVSCLTNQRIHSLLNHIDRLVVTSSKRVSTARINEALQNMVAKHTPQLIKKYSKRVKFYYATQVCANPPTIVVKCNIENEIQTAYRRYMMNCFRKELGFADVPIRVYFRGKSETEKGKRAERVHLQKVLKDDVASGRSDQFSVENLPFGEGGEFDLD